MSKQYVVRVMGKEYNVSVEEVSPGKFKVKVDGYELEVESPIMAGVTTTAKPATTTATETKPSGKPERREEKPAPTSAPAAQPTTPAPAPTPAAKPAAPTPAGGAVVEAPVPGKILKVLVQPGQRVTKRTVIITLESMKMELEIYPPKDGVVKEIRVKPGDFVNTGDVLAIIE